MNWNPKHWTWPPRLTKRLRWLRRTTPRAPAIAWNALRNADRNDLRRIWTRLLRIFGIIAAWLKRNYVWILIITVGGFFSYFWSQFIWRLPDLIRTALDLLSGELSTPSTDGHEVIRSLAYAIGALLAALALLAAAPFQLIKVWVNERQATTAEQGLITDRLTKAVEQLGAEKTVRRREFKQRYKIDREKAGGEDRVKRDEDGNPIPATRVGGDLLGDWEAVEETTPNLEVRLGAIYALERIAQDSERDHIPIMETLCAYIRENAPASGAENHDLGDWPDWPEGADEEAHSERETARELWGMELAEWAIALPAPRVDIRAALSVIGRRGEERIAHERRQRSGGRGNDRANDPGFRLDLRGANLQNADLTRARLDHALLTGARMEGANLRRARMEAADLRGARIEGADLRGARLDGVYLRWARMEAANLKGARMEGANLRRARMEAANLSSVRMEGADFSQARMEGVDLSEARMEGADLRGARLEGADLRRARLDGANLRRARLDGANLREARLDRANLRRARFEGADLRVARLDGAYLREARLDGADLREARLDGADLRGARLDGVNLHSATLKSTDLEDWTIARTSLRSADFTNAKHLTQDHVNAAFGDSATLLPPGIVIPDHWNDEAIRPYTDDPKYQAWLAAGAPPGKPRKPPPG